MIESVVGDGRPIGVFDSGVGGLTVFQALERALPGESLVYLGDTARVPYGIRSAETVVRYSREAARFMRAHAVKMLVVACNTASSVAMEALIEEEDVPVLGVIEPGARRAVSRTRSGRIGVIGTRATVASGAYRRSIEALRPQAQVISRACPLFVPLAEEGWTDNAVAHQVAEVYLRPMRDDGVDTLVLGCTHYPLLRDTIARVMGAGVELVDSAETVAAAARRLLIGGSSSEADAGESAETDLPAGERRSEALPGTHGAGRVAEAAGSAGGVEHHFFVTDAPEPFQQVAERFLGRPIARLERTHIEGA